MRSHGIYTQRGLRVSGDRCALLVLSRTQVLLHERTPLRFVLLPCSEGCACANANPVYLCCLPVCFNCFHLDGFMRVQGAFMTRMKPSIWAFSVVCVMCFFSMARSDQQR